ncbi:ATP-binding protein (plasmid) [Bacillus sp. F19]|nr:ATP-binding protein [Bacillus sp. F19]
MVGLPCSGKTTLAQKLEKKYSALRLTPDIWHIRLFGHDTDDKDHNARHDLVESLLWDVADRVLILGVDVILDFGFWGRSERDEFRSRAAELGADFKIHFLDATEEMLLERLAARNAQLPQGTFHLSETNLKEYMLLFEPPSQEELE